MGDFEITPDDFTFYEKIKVPPPTFCPTCRMQKRMMFRNERTFYRRLCDLCQKSIISTYSPEVEHPVYCTKCWWSDDWNPAIYGIDFDFSKPFFDQINDLQKKVPALAILNDNDISSVNCEYNYDWFYSKNCYMNVSGWHAENVLYSYHIEHNKDMMDSMHMRDSELAYECLQSYKIARSAFCTYCSDSTDCFFGFDLKGCVDCIMCVGLRNKSHCIKNVQYSKEEYEVKKQALGLESFNGIQKCKKEFEALLLQFPHRHAYILNSINSTGDFLLNSKNVQNSFMIINAENLKYFFGGDTSKDSYDCDMSGKTQLANNCVVADESMLSLCTVFCTKANDVAYSLYCPGAEWSFGCIGFKKASYSILNKHYTKEEYIILKEKIIEHMKQTGEYGQFFSNYCSSYTYNESSAQEIFPLSQDEAISLGYTWRKGIDRNYQIEIHSNDIPDILPNDESLVVDKIIECSHKETCNHKCTSAFKVTNDEYILYKKLKLPIPHECPNCRHAERIKRRHPLRLWNRQCMCDKTGHLHGGQKCEVTFETSYSPDRPEIVYCEKCYQQEVL